MAVQPQTPYKEYDANGVTTSFALEFDCEKKDHLIVTVDGAEPPVETWSLNSGHIVFASAPAAGKKIEIKRNTPYSRSTNFQAYDNSFRPGPINGDFDRIWLKLQELGVANWLMKQYVDRKDDELKAFLMEEIRKQGVALDQLDEYYNYLMQRLAQIAVDKGWDASFIVDGNLTQHERNTGIKSIAQLRLIAPSKKGDRVYLVSVNDGQGEGGGEFIATQKAGLVDNGGTVIETPDPNLFWVRIVNDVVTPQMFGAKHDGIADDLVAFQGAVLSGHEVYVPSVADSYYLSDSLSIPAGTSFSGAGAESVKIISAVSGDDPAIMVSGTYGDTGMKFASFGGFFLQSVMYSRTGIGLILDGLSYFKLRDVVVQAFNLGVYAKDCINITWEKCYIINNIRALTAEKGSYSHPNAWSFNDCVINGNWDSGCTFISGCAISFTGGSIELNGIQGIGDINSKYGIKMLGNPYEGVVGLNVKDVYFEGNKGQADVVIDTSPNPNDAIHTITTSTFNRISATNFVNNNVLLNKQGAGRTVLCVSGCGFKRFNDYEANYYRPYIDVVSATNSNYHVDLAVSNYYHDRNETPRVSGTQSSTKSSVAAWVRFNGTNIAAANQTHNVSTIERLSTGKYKINYSKPLYVAGNVYSITTNHVGFSLIDSEDSSYVVVQILDKDNNAIDASLVSVIVFGEDT